MKRLVINMEANYNTVKGRNNEGFFNRGWNDGDGKEVAN